MQVLTDLRHCESGVSRQRIGHTDLRGIRTQGLPSTMLASGPGGRKPRPGPFLNQPPLKLGERRKNMEDEFASRCRRVEHTITQRPEADLPLPQFCNPRYSMYHRASPAI